MRKITYKKIPDELKKMVQPLDISNKSRSSVGHESNVGEFFYISIEDLIPFKSQARKNFDITELNALAESIKEHGIRQPLTILPSEEFPGKYEIVSGERRFKAAKIAGLTRVPCIIIKDKEKAEEIALVENIHREDLHPIELGDAYKKLLDKNNELTPIDLAKKLAISKSQIYEYISYLNIPESTQLYLVQNNIKSQSILRKLLKTKDPIEIDKILGKISQQKRKSILRVNLAENNFIIQDKGIYKLSGKERNMLIDQLENIIIKIKEIK